jgi:GYF domain 2
MNYTVIRDGQQFGPYTLADLQKYVVSGNILLTDLARSEGMTEAVPVGQIIGNISLPAASAPVVQEPGLVSYPYPPNLAWGLVLLFAIVTCGLFLIAWDIVLALWMRQVQPASRAIYYYGAVLFLYLGVFTFAFNAGMHHSKDPTAGLLNIAIWILSLVARFSMKNSLEEHFNSADPIGLSLSGVMTFFFGSIYFQYHLNQIMKRKQELWYGQRPA